MAKAMKNVFFLIGFYLAGPCVFAQQSGTVTVNHISYNLYPAVYSHLPDIPSPFMDPKGEEYVTVATREEKFGIMRVTLRNEGTIGQQLVVDTADFPVLAKTGLHDVRQLTGKNTITGRPVSEITRLAQPGQLSQDGFLAPNEDILTVIKNDNLLVKEMGLTHPELARPLFHVLNMMDTDLDLNRWNMRRHHWDNVIYFMYNGHRVFVDAEDTKGGQRSIFADGLEGGFHIRLWRELTPSEERYLRRKFSRLSEPQFERLKKKLTVITTGELEPQYIMRYGFYEGNTYWRTDPIALAVVFGLKEIQAVKDVISHHPAQPD